MRGGEGEGEKGRDSYARSTLSYVFHSESVNAVVRRVSSRFARLCELESRKIRLEKVPLEKVDFESVSLARFGATRTAPSVHSSVEYVERSKCEIARRESAPSPAGALSLSLLLSMLDQRQKIRLFTVVDTVYSKKLYWSAKG